MGRRKRIQTKKRICTECGASFGNVSDEQYYLVSRGHSESAEHKASKERAKTIRFFIPAATGAAQAEGVYAAIKEFAKTTVGGVTGRRIFAIAYKHDEQQYYAEVGKAEPR
jgi:hypothetical protein